MWIHEEYERTYQQNDIALLRLSEESMFTPICMPSIYELFDHGDKGIVAGWGQTEAKDASDVVRKAELNIWKNAECEGTFSSDYPAGTNTSNLLCAFRPGHGSCRGDSGGPLICRSYRGTSQGGVSHFAYEACGIVSQSPKKCGLVYKPGVYTRVSQYIPWINNIVKSNASDALTDVKHFFARNIECTTLPGESAGSGKQCSFPFVYKNVLYDGCTTQDDTKGKYWCSTKTDNSNRHVGGDNWGYCQDKCTAADSSCGVGFTCKLSCNGNVDPRSLRICGNGMFCCNEEGVQKPKYTAATTTTTTMKTTTSPTTTTTTMKTTTSLTTTTTTMKTTTSPISITTISTAGILRYPYPDIFNCERGREDNP